MYYFENGASILRKRSEASVFNKKMMSYEHENFCAFLSWQESNGSNQTSNKYKHSLY